MLFFRIHWSSLDQKYLTQHVQTSRFLMWTRLKINVNARGRAKSIAWLQPERLRRRLKPRENELKPREDNDSDQVSQVFLAKPEEKKNKIMHKKRRRKHWYTRKHEKTFMQVSPLISGICTGNVRKEILIFLILFEWKVLNRHNFDLPDINQYCSHCRISVNLQWKDFQDKPWINSICFGNESKQCLFFKVSRGANQPLFW